MLAEETLISFYNSIVPDSRCQGSIKRKKCTRIRCVDVGLDQNTRLKVLQDWTQELPFVRAVRTTYPSTEDD